MQETEFDSLPHPSGSFLVDTDDLSHEPVVKYSFTTVAAVIFYERLHRPAAAAAAAVSPIALVQPLLVPALSFCPVLSRPRGCMAQVHHSELGTRHAS